MNSIEVVRFNSEFGGVTAHFRPDTSDPYVLQEVIMSRIYRRKKINFDVEKDEDWLDLGANIGAFALYCQIRGAEATCYEPDLSCFEILRLNAPNFVCRRMAVTHHHDLALPAWRGRKDGNFSKITVVSSPSLLPYDRLPNIYAGHLIDQQFDGVKMDIEGSEGELIDQWLLPKCNKLVMEYHSSRDKSPENLGQRLEILKSKFEIVSYPPELDRVVAGSKNENLHGTQLTYFDRMIFCMGAK